ncbi:MAG: hypothetical protein IPM94_02460 [bacterium]|nr:hypothetical protein [bacterium]
MGFEFLVPWHAFLPRGGGHVVVFYGHEDAAPLRDAAAAALAAEGAPCLCVGADPGGNDPADLDAFAAAHPDRVLLVAAPAADAALPARATLAVPVVPLTGSAQDGWDALVERICGPDGLLRRAGAQVPAAPALLRLDDCLDSIGLFAALDRLMAPPGAPLLVLGEVRGPQPRLRAAYRSGGPLPETDA